MAGTEGKGYGMAGTDGHGTAAHGARPGPVTADDVAEAVRLAVAALDGGARDVSWAGKAGPLEWDCWETVEHLADDLFGYAVHLGQRAQEPLPLLWEGRMRGGPANVIYAERASGPAGLLQVLEACSTLLVSVVRTSPPEARAFHGFGTSDAEGFAAMGVVETLVHAHDVAEGLGLPWRPPEELCDRVLYRLFPDVPADTDRWRTLLWATGRADLPGQARRTSWRWYGEPRTDRDATADQAG